MLPYFIWIYIYAFISNPTYSTPLVKNIDFLSLNIALTSNTVDTFFIFSKSSLSDLPLTKMSSILSALLGYLQKSLHFKSLKYPTCWFDYVWRTNYYFNLLLVFIVTYFFWIPHVLPIVNKIWLDQFQKSFHLHIFLKAIPLELVVGSCHYI